MRFAAADMPEANEMVVGNMAVMAQAGRKMISARTKAALAAAKVRGTKLGGDRGNLAEVGAAGRAKGTQARQEKAKARAGDLAPNLASLRAEGVATLRGLAEALNAREIPTTRGGTWSAVQVQRVLTTLS